MFGIADLCKANIDTSRTGLSTAKGKYADVDDRVLKRMIRPMKGNRMNRLTVQLGWAGLRLLSFAPSGESLPLRSIVLAGLFLVLLTLVTVEKENLLRVAGRHTASVRTWRVAVKRTTMPVSRGGNV